MEIVTITFLSMLHWRGTDYCAVGLMHCAGQSDYFCYHDMQSFSVDVLDIQQVKIVTRIVTFTTEICAYG